MNKVDFQLTENYLDDITPLYMYLHLLLHALQTIHIWQIGKVLGMKFICSIVSVMGKLYKYLAEVSPI